jgi:hypothetical protein
MIEINLSPRSKDNKLENLGGFNLSLINVKMTVFAFIALYAIDPFVDDYYDTELERISTTQKKIRSKQRKITTKLRKLDDVKKQVEDLNLQETNLAKKINVVKKIVDKRQNPFKVLKYITENIPPDVWVIEIELDDRNIKIIGFSKSWKSIGKFLQNLKSSIFFETNMSFDKPEGLETELQGQRVEAFEIKTTVIRFE